MTFSVFITILGVTVIQPSATQEDFLISFQQSSSESGALSVEEWAEYTDKIPNLKEFTTCHWEYLRYFANGLNQILVLWQKVCNV